MLNYRLKSMNYRKYNSQVEFAAELQISESLLSRVIRGWRPATPELRQQIARKLGIEEQEIFPGNADEK